MTTQHRMDRRQLLRVTGGAAAIAITGIPGILAAGCGPAAPRGTTVHLVRWNDFIPEADAELRRQMQEAEKALGARITFETINANDLQARITAAIQSGSGADIFHMLWFEACEGYSVAATTVWEDHPMWERIDPPLRVFRRAARATRIFGHAGPASAKATEVFSKYIVTDMYARAVRSGTAEEAVGWADRELRKIYG
jgi:hypothetical protein